MKLASKICQNNKNFHPEGGIDERNAEDCVNKTLGAPYIIVRL